MLKLKVLKMTFFHFISRYRIFLETKQKKKKKYQHAQKITYEKEIGEVESTQKFKGLI